MIPGELHPAIVHTPIALIVTSALFELVGRAVDLEWWRKAAMAMLVVGVLGAGAAVLSGKAAETPAAEQQGVPHEPIERHERAAFFTLGLGVAAVAARLAAGGRPAIGLLALVLHLAAAAAVGITSYRGGELVYRHGAGVRVQGQLIESGPRRTDLEKTAER